MNTILDRSSVGQLVWLFVCGLLISAVLFINFAYYGINDRRELSMAEIRDLLERGSASSDAPPLSGAETQNLLETGSVDDNSPPLSESEKRELLEKTSI